MKSSTQAAVVLWSLSWLGAGCGGGAAAATSSAAVSGGTGTSDLIPSLQPYATPTGTVATYTAAGEIDPSGIFFQALGSNARTCATCHELSQGMSLSAASTQALFTSSGGADPLFDAVDGANCPTAAAGDAAGRSLLLDNGLIRIGRALPAGAQYQLAVLQDPYGCAVTDATATAAETVSVYRRPLPATNLGFLSDVMWDTRETVEPLNAAASFSANLATDLAAQAADAVATHEQGSAGLSAAQLGQLVAFEEGLDTAEASDDAAGALNATGVSGGAAALAGQTYYPGINDAAGGDPQGAAFNPVVFTLYQAWRNSANAQQASIARGEDIFNTAPMRIEGVGGFNPPGSAPAPGSCGACHDTPNVGNHSLPVPMDTGISHVAASETDPAIVAGLAQLTPPSLPVYQITGCSGASGTPLVEVTTDPGVGLFSGQCADVNRVKIPVLRGLGARAPYFHNGSAATLAAVVNFYNARFQMNLSPQQMQDLVNFLGAL